MLRYEGLRPGPGWHRHDWRLRRLWVLSPAGLSRQRVLRRRWRRAGTTETYQDRSPDEVGALSVVLVAILLKLWAYLDSDQGLYRYPEAIAALAGVGCRRTVARWLARFLPYAGRMQQGLRIAVIERCEPRPIERLFPGGLSPPASLRCRRWKDPSALYSLWTALAFLVHGAVALKTTMSVLGVEAWRRDPGLFSIAAG